MSLGRYLVGVVLTAAVLAAVAMAAVALRRRLLTGWSGAPARLAEAVLAAGVLFTVPTLLGLLGLLERAPLVATYVLAGLAAALTMPRSRGAAAGPAAPAPAPAAVWVAIGATALVVAQWAIGVIGAYSNGMEASDTLSYHGPITARFVQDASITQLHVVYADPVIVFFPFNSELIHAAAFLLFGSDALSPLVNLGWLALALLAGWCLGRPKGLGPATLVATALVLGVPALVGSQAGSEGNDIVCVALLLSAAALLLSGFPRGGAVALAALAGGLAVGTKVTMLAPVGALMIGVVAISRPGLRLRTAGGWLALLALGGGAWYLRNLLRTGSPMPSLDIGVGALSLPHAPQPQTFSVAHYLTDGKIWSDWFFPGLNEAFGPLWWVVVGVALIGIAGIVAGRTERIEKVLAGVVVLSIVAYILTPRSADGPEGFPYFFSFTLRYVAPSLALAAALAVLVPRLRPLASRWWALLALVGVLVVTLLDFEGIAAGDRRRVAIAMAAAAVLAVASQAPRPRPAVAAATAALIGVAVLAAGFKVQRDYADDRYAGSDLAWGRDLSHSRIATVGWVRSYPLYGSDFSNVVDYVARRGDAGAVLDIGDCAGWRRALNAGRYDYVVTSPPVFPYALPGLEEAKESPWTRSDPAAEEVLRAEGNLVVFRLNGPLDPGGCGRS
jgi:hypothetical protein